jgi:D-arabinose 5-phosphate isomerase GutQ
MEECVAALEDRKVIDLARGVISANGRAVLASLEAVDETFVQVARLLAACKGKVLVTGSGTSGNVASRAAHLLSVCGTPSFYLSPADGLHGGLGVLQRDDVVLALSKGGRSAELNDFCARARARCSCLVVVTASAGTPLAALADHVIRLDLEADTDLGSVVATGSSLAIATAVDALAEVGRIARNYSWDDLLFTHPSGAVGRDAQQSLERLSAVKDS